MHGIVVMVDDSCSRGRVFESRHPILDGSHLFGVKMYCLVETTEINENEAGVGPFKKEWMAQSKGRGQHFNRGNLRRNKMDSTCHTC